MAGFVYFKFSSRFLFLPQFSSSKDSLQHESLTCGGREAYPLEGCLAVALRYIYLTIYLCIFFVLLYDWLWIRLSILLFFTELFFSRKFLPCRLKLCGEHRNASSSCNAFRFSSWNALLCVAFFIILLPWIENPIHGRRIKKRNAKQRVSWGTKTNLIDCIIIIYVLHIVIRCELSVFC